MKQVSYPYQPYGKSPQGWEAVQFTDDSASEAVVLCFRAASSQSASVVRFSRLRPDATYSIKRTDGKSDEKVSGKELMTAGLLVDLANRGSSEILQLKADA